MQLVRKDCSCLQTAGEGSVSRRLCHANCVIEGLALHGRSSSKASISRLSFFLFSYKSGNLLDSWSELAASSTGCCPVGSGLPQLDADAILRSKSDARQWHDSLAGRQPQRTAEQARPVAESLPSSQSFDDANPRARTYNLLDIATIVGGRCHE